MKKVIAFVLLMVIVLSMTLSGCNELTDYVINPENVIKIGVILSESKGDSYGEEVLEGINYASELAPAVNIKDRYLVQLSVCNINDNLTDVASKLINEKVAAVIVAAESKAKTEEVIEAFDGAHTPLLFVDCYSDEILSDEESFVISTPYSYQSSVLASYFSNKGYKNGAVIYSGDNYSGAFAKLFKDTFISSGGTDVAEYTFEEDVSQLDVNTVTSSNPDFVFIIGNNKECVFIHSLFDSVNDDLVMAFSEVFDKTILESSEFDNTLFISKLEVDVDNYIGADFLSVYSTKKDINKSDIPAAVAYGYDAYMLIYGALMSYNESYGEEGAETDTNNNEIMSSDIKSAIAKITHLGVTDSINFDDRGLINSNFVYLSAIENSKAVMLNRYNYSNENKGQ